MLRLGSSSAPSARWPAREARPASQLRASASGTTFFTLIGESETINVTKAPYTIGSSPSADLRLSAPNLHAEHAVVERKGQQFFLKALVGEDLFDDTHCWIDGTPLRPRVAYLLGSGGRLAFGDAAKTFTITFQQGEGSNPLLHMMMQGMASQASPSVKESLQQKL
ncbi:hypothetical protein V8C86DRAFT_2734482 [Haematococcus lacustris]